MAIVAFVLLITEVGEEHRIVREATEKFRGDVEGAWVTYGEYDAVIKVSVPDMRRLDEVVSGIRSIRGVRRTTTLITA